MIIITTRTVQYIKKSVIEGNRFFFHPYEWNDRESCPELTTSKRRLLMWWLNVMFTFSYSAFVVYRAICVSASEEASVTQKIYMGFVMAVFSFPVFFQLNILWSLKEFPHFVLDFMRYSRHFQSTRPVEKFTSICRPHCRVDFVILNFSFAFTEKYIGSQEKSTTLARICEVIIVTVYYSFLLDITLFIIAATFRPTSPEQLSSVSPAHPVGLVERLISVLVLSYYVYGLVCNAYLNIFTCFAWYFTVFQILGEFRYEKLNMKSSNFSCDNIYLIVFPCCEGKKAVPSHVPTSIFPW